MKLFNLHTHSRYCDGSHAAEEYVQASLTAGFHTLGFSSHAPVPFENNFAIRDEAMLMEYCDTIRELQNRYKDVIQIRLGLEIDYIEGVTRDFESFREKCGLDYIIGSVHLVRNGGDTKLWFIDGSKVESYDRGLEEVFGGDVRKAISMYYSQVNSMISTQKPDIVGHFDKIKMHNKGRYFREDEPWYVRLVMDTLDNIKRTGVIVEVNTRGIYKKRSEDLYPGAWILQRMRDMDIHITLSSDAHDPVEIDGFYPETIGILKKFGYRSLYYYGNEGWVDQAI